MNNFGQISEGDGTIFLVRWRGRQEGPHTGAVIEAKLAANEIGLLHEIYYDGKWITIRDYIKEREEVLRRETQAGEVQERSEREAAESQAREREEHQRAELLAEERRKNDALAAALARQSTASPAPISSRTTTKPHRGGQILALGLAGFIICGPLCLAAWLMGSTDLREMDAGMMDESGRSSTSSGRNIGILGTVLWIIGAAFFIFLR